MKKVVKSILIAFFVTLIGEAMGNIFYPLSILEIVGHYMFVRAIIVAIGDNAVHAAARGALKKAIVGASAARDYIHAEMEAAKNEANEAIPQTDEETSSAEAEAK